MKTWTVTLVLAGGFLLLLAVSGQAQVAPTWEWVNFTGSITFNGQPAPVGCILNAYDPTAVNCGRDTVISAGLYGFMPVYRDDPFPPNDTTDEGADPGDSIFFKIMGREAVVLSGDVVWDANGQTHPVDLSAAGIIAVTGVDFPTDTVGAPDSTIRFMVGVRNDGDGLDFYGVTSTSARGWQTVNQDTFTYADSGEIVYVYFDVIIPTWPGTTPDTVTFSVFSYLDTTKRVDSSVELIASVPTDVHEDPLAELPQGFHLRQNYPNPFNPTTTISFTLSSRSSARLEVFNVLGQQVHIRDLSVLPSGDYSVEYDASGLPSGVYFYRLVTEAGSQVRKMVLIR